MPAPDTAVTVSSPSARGNWLRLLQRWHWISAALSLAALLLFAVTGVTLNHASQIPATPRVQAGEALLPAKLLPALATEETSGPLPAGISQWLENTTGLRLRDRAPEWEDDAVTVTLPGPGADAWVSVDRASGEVLWERTDRGWIAYLNDLHKGRHTGAAWRWLIDLLAVACIVFCVTGIALMALHARQRALTWPITGLGVLIPLLVAALLVH